MSDPVGRYVRLLCHELNNPLTVLMGQPTLLRAVASDLEPDRAKLARIADQMDANVARVARMISELRELLAERSAQSLTLVPLAALLGGLRDILRREADARGARVNIDLPPADVLAYVDPTLIRGALWRLCDGLITDGGTLTVAWTSAEAALHVHVRGARPPAEGFDPRAIEDRLRTGGGRLVAVRDGFEIHFPRVD